MSINLTTQDPYNQCFELCIWYIAYFYFVQFLFWSFVLFFFGDIFLCLPFLAASLFVSMYQVEKLLSPGLIEWTYVVGVLTPVVQSPWSPAPGAPGVCLVWVVCILLLQLSLNYCCMSVEGTDLGLICCEDWP